MAIKEYRGYQSYHGRMPGWKKAVIAILVLILICALIFIMVQRNRVFDSNGSHIKLPFGGKNDPPVSDTVDEDPGKDDDLIIDIQKPESKVAELHGVTIDAAALQAADFSSLQADQRPVVTMKAANGTVLPDFPDRNEIATRAGEAVSWAYSRGVMTGKTGGKLDPNGNASRAEAAVMLYRFLKLSPNGEKQ